MTDKNIDTKALDDFLKSSHDVNLAPPDALITRVLADAQTVQAGFAPSARPATYKPRWREVIEALGGWPSMAGLSAAGIAGICLGLFPPGDLPQITDAVLGLEDPAYLIDISTELAFNLSEETL